MKYDKLVRDKMPEIIRQKGGVPVTHVADEKEYWQKLKEKLSEEVAEFQQDESAEEIADILEVLDAIISHQKLDPDELHRIMQKKVEERGGFSERIILEES